MHKIKRDDLVKVIAGKDRDKQGKVLHVDTKNNKVLVEGCNMITKHVKPGPGNPQGGIVFFGTGRSLLQQTFDRFKQVIPMENILIVTNDLYADLVKEQLPELKPEQILLEPTRRNTAPCIAWASYHIRAYN